MSSYFLVGDLATNLAVAVCEGRESAGGDQGMPERGRPSDAPGASRARLPTTRRGVERLPYSPRTMSALTASPSPSRLASASSPQPQNPIALRLYKVLGASFDDAATREALQTLSELYAPTSVSHPSLKGKDVNRDGDDTHLDDFEDVEVQTRATLNGAHVAEPIPGDIAARARRNLRRDVENRLAESSRKFLKAFGDVDKVCTIDIFVCLSPLFC